MTEYEIPFIYKFEIVTESDFGFSMGRAPTCIWKQNPVCVRWKKKGRTWKPRSKLLEWAIAMAITEKVG